MWGNNQPPHSQQPPPYYGHNPNQQVPPLYPNVNNPYPQQPNIPVLHYDGGQAAPASAPYQYAGGPPLPNYGFQPPAGSVPSYPSPYPHPQQQQGDEEWITVSHNSPFPNGAVQAMDRPLTNNDQSAKNCYVALWTKNNEPIFGRAWNHNGRVEAWFPYGGHEHHSGSTGSFKILAYRGPPYQNFRYAWVPINQLNAMCQPVRQQDYSPVVIGDVRLGNFNGELLGKGHLARKMAWVSYAGKEHYFSDNAFDRSYVLCRVPL